MIYDLLDYFRDEELSKKKVIDNYRLKDGLYICADDIGIKRSMIVTKKTEPDREYEWFKERDYLSAVPTTNKCFDAPNKVMHNNNYLTLFFKCKSLFNDAKNQERSPDFNNNMDFYYEKMIAKLQSSEVLEFGESMQIPKIDLNEIENCRKMIAKALAIMLESKMTEELDEGVYIKIFVDREISDYQRESLRYTLPYIFNSNAYNVDTANGKYGLSALNMGLNSKKPFFVHRTTRYKVPFRISLPDALIGKRLYDWLGQQRNGYLDVSDEDAFELKSVRSIGKKQNAHYLSIDHGIENVIADYDFLPGITDDVQSFFVEDYLQTGFFESKRTSSRSDIEMLVDQYLFGNKLRSNYKTQAKDIKISPKLSTNLYKSIVLYRKAFEDYFVRCDDRAIKACINKATMNLVLAKIDKDETKFFIKTGNAINMRYALLKYFNVEGGSEMGSKVKALWEELNDKKQLKDGLVECENDDQFYFAAGQLARYIISQSEAKDLNYSMVDACIKAKTPQRLKNELSKLFEKYSHAFLLNYNGFNNIMSMVTGYEADEQSVNQDLFLAGLASKNVLFMKKEDK